MLTARHFAANWRGRDAEDVALVLQEANSDPDTRSSISTLRKHRDEIG